MEDVAAIRAQTVLRLGYRVSNPLASFSQDVAEFPCGLVQSRVGGDVGPAWPNTRLWPLK
jgi:hypothetical protein